MRLTLRAIAPVLLLSLSSASFAQDWAVKRLDASPRHHEYVTLQVMGKPVQAFVDYPEVSHKAAGVVMIHEIFGLSGWMKTMADDVAASGYIAIAPDLLSGMGPNGGGTDAFPSQDAVTKAVGTLDPAFVNAALDAAADYVKKLPSSNGKLAVAGFCWGGGKSFAFATHRPDLSAAFVFYGPPPPAADMKNIHAPVYGFFAGNDARIGAMVPGAISDMKAAGKTFDPVTYDGAGHGFMRAGVDPNNAVEANKTAREQAFTRMKAELAKIDAAPAKAAGKALLYSPVKKQHVVATKPTMQCHDMTMSGM
jgi:carboxymethylenebutenolidase